MPGIGLVIREISFEIVRILRKQKRICMVKLFNGRELSDNEHVLFPSCL